MIGCCATQGSETTGKKIRQNVIEAVFTFRPSDAGGKFAISVTPAATGVVFGWRPRSIWSYFKGD